MQVTHAFVSAKPDGSDPTQVQPSHWNDGHVVVPFSKTVTFTRTPGAGTYTGTWDLPVGTVGVRFVVKVTEAWTAVSPVVLNVGTVSGGVNTYVNALDLNQSLPFEFAMEDFPVVVYNGSDISGFVGSYFDGSEYRWLEGRAFPAGDTVIATVEDPEDGVGGSVEVSFLWDVPPIAAAVKS